MKTLFAILALSFCLSAHAETHAGSLGGRFQVVQLSEYRRDQFMIDTQTGMIWHHVCEGNESDNCAWISDPVEGKTMSLSNIVKRLNPPVTLRDPAEVK